MASINEHIIVCSICRRGLIVKDIINNGVAFLSHLKLDHDITYTPQRMTKERQSKKYGRANVRNHVNRFTKYQYDLKSLLFFPLLTRRNITFLL